MNPPERAVLHEAVKLLTNARRITQEGNSRIHYDCTIVWYERLHKDVVAMLNGLLHPCECNPCECKCNDR